MLARPLLQVHGSGTMNRVFYPKENLAYWIDMTHCVGQDMCYCVLPFSGVPIAKMTIEKYYKRKCRLRIFQLKKSSYPEPLKLQIY
jgi:hypothetical protein